VCLDLAVGIKLLENGIFKEKARQKMHDIYGTFPVAANGETREIIRQLDLAKEELALKEAVVAATSRRQQQQEKNLMKLSANSFQRSDDSSAPSLLEPPPIPVRAKDKHREPLSENYDWLTGKILASGTAAHMFQQVLSLGEIWKRSRMVLRVNQLKN
jgi:hypothetical protein